MLYMEFIEVKLLVQVKLLLVIEEIFVIAHDIFAEDINEDTAVKDF